KACIGAAPAGKVAYGSTNTWTIRESSCGRMGTPPALLFTQLFGQENFVPAGGFATIRSFTPCSNGPVLTPRPSPTQSYGWTYGSGQLGSGVLSVYWYSHPCARFVR